jgi:transposase
MISEKIKVVHGREEPPRGIGIPLTAATAQGARFMASPAKLPDPEVPEKAVRRRFTAEYKLNILHQAEACRDPGSVGALLRREGLYSSHLTTWRRQRDAGVLSGLQPKQRGRKPHPVHPLEAQLSHLRKENERLQNRLRKAELIIDVQKKISQMLGIPMENPEISEDD